MEYRKAGGDTSGGFGDIHMMGGYQVKDRVFGRIKCRSWSHAFSGAGYEHRDLDTENCIET